ncbi:MAG: Citrate synthase [Geminicoccaceae bacterium]|nr:Citrate synthase [Geminicoccaceae bacterium]
MRPGAFLTAAETAEMLGVTRATLYAYVSRGLLRSEPIPGRTRARRYYREDVERLTERKAMRRDPSRVAAQALRWGGPVLESGITLIQDGAFYYRGHDAIALAATSSVETVAALLWGADESEAARLFDQPSPLTSRQVARLDAQMNEPLAALQAALPIAAAADLASLDLRPHAVRLAGGRIVRLFATVISRTDACGPLHDMLRSAWASHRPAVGDIIRTALVLCADHELNISAFTARCAASAGASPYDVVSAGLATLKGHKHGGATMRVLELVRQCETPKQARSAIAHRLRSGETVPGFGHPLYPTVDPRAAVLIRLADASGNAAALEPLLLFTLGRTIGWIAHAIEEYASGRLIRPRARYVGPAPMGK